MTAPLIHGYEVVIGFETHSQLSTQSKIFSRASTAFGAEPNTQACAVDLALPGTLPVMNRGALERAIRFGLAVGAGDLRTGDLVIFGNDPAWHAGIYVGEGRFVHAPSTGGTVRLDRLDNRYWARQPVRYRRP